MVIILVLSSCETSEALRMIKTNFQSFLQTVQKKVTFNHDCLLFHLEFKVLDFRNNLMS